jgi:hypothetical protein
MWKYAVYFADATSHSSFVIVSFSGWQTLRWEIFDDNLMGEMFLEKFDAMHRARWASYLVKPQVFTQ